MKTRIENKVNEIIECILVKDVKDISKDEFDILVSRLTEIKIEENNKESRERVAKLMAETFGNN